MLSIPNHRYTTANERYYDQVYSHEFNWLCSRIKIPVSWSRYAMINGRILPSSTWPSMMDDLQVRPPKNLSPTQLQNVVKFLGMGCFPYHERWEEDLHALLASWLLVEPSSMVSLFQYAVSSCQHDLFIAIAHTLRHPPHGVCPTQLSDTVGLIVAEVHKHIRHIINRPSADGNENHHLEQWNDFSGTHLLPQLAQLLACLPHPTAHVLAHVRKISQDVAPIYGLLDTFFRNYVQQSMSYIDSYLRSADLNALTSRRANDIESPQPRTREVLL